MDGHPEAETKHRKDLALLAFLALEPGPHAREELATLLWSGSPDDKARASLRQTLKRLRDLLGEQLLADRSTVELRDLPCDVLEFEQAAVESPATVTDYAVTRFLSGFTIHHAPAFDEWADGRRRQLVRLYQDAAARMAREAMSRWRWGDAAAWADRALEIDPLSDDLTRLAMESWYLAGDRGVALARFANHVESLEQQLGTGPSTAMRALHQRIDSDTGRPTADPISAEWSVRTPGLEGTLVGREKPWKRLAALWQQVQDGHGRTCLLEGDTGAGTTRLAHEFASWARTQGALVLEGQGTDVELGVALAPVAEALQGALEAPGLAGTPPAWLAEAARLLPDLRLRFENLPDPIDPSDGAQRWRLFESAAQLGIALAAEQPLVFLFDDLDRYDSESCALLHFLARRWVEEPVLLLATYTLGNEDVAAEPRRLHRAWRGSDGVETLAIDPLTERDVRDLIRQLGRISGPDLGDRFCRRVYEVSKGNVFYLREILRGLFEQQVLVVSEDGEWVLGAEARARDFQMPDTILSAVEQRLDALPTVLRDLLTTIAVGRIPCSVELLATVTHLPRLDVAARCDQLTEAHLAVEERDGFVPAHPMIADAIRRTLSPARRAELHRAFALSLDTTTPADRRRALAGRIARHADRGGVPQLATQAALEAARGALLRFAFEEALSWLDLAARQDAGASARAEVDALTADVLARAGLNEGRERTSGKDSMAQRLVTEDLDLRAGSAGDQA
jgi:DNA-binding SARP family transcriptional activator